MAYLLLIQEPPGQRDGRTDAQGREVYQRMLDYAAELRRAGVLRSAESLASASASVQAREGRAVVLDGPFAEAKEMVGGFFLVDCATREEAIAIAARCPAAEWARVEVRETGPCFT